MPTTGLRSGYTAPTQMAVGGCPRRRCLWRRHRTIAPGSASHGLDEPRLLGLGDAPCAISWVRAPRRCVSPATPERAKGSTIVLLILPARTPAEANDVDAPLERAR